MIALVTPSGEVRQVADDIHFGNGMAVTPDGRTLIVAESFARRLSAFDVLDDGSLGRRRVWAEVPGGVDGISLAPDGSVWAAGMRNCVRVREGGEVVETVDSDRFCFSCAVGGDVLYVLAARWPGWRTWPRSRGRARFRRLVFRWERKRCPRATGGCQDEDMADVLRFPPNRAPVSDREPEPLWREVLGHSLRTVREQQGGRLVDVAERAGISPQYLSEIERGRKEPSSEMIAAVTGALGVDLAGLLTTIAGDVRRIRGAGPAVRQRPTGPVLMAA
ncbi:hypothetical protein GCM10029964_050330 [Kibdelosporangium lantanae]